MSLVDKPVNLYSSYLVTGLKVHVLNADLQTEPNNIETLQFRATHNKGPFQRAFVAMDFLNYKSWSTP